MIVETFRYPHKPVTPPAHTYFPKKHTVTDLTPTFTPHEYKMSDKLNIKPHTYRVRVSAVEAAYKSCKWKPGDEGFPHTWKDFQEHGKCRVVAVCNHYDNYGDVSWNDPPYILQICQVDDPNSIINCTANWLVDHQPQEKKEGSAC